MRNNWIFIAYYIYAIVVVILSGYVIFVLNRSGWWMLVTFLLLNISPSIKQSKDE